MHLLVPLDGVIAIFIAIVAEALVGMAMGIVGQLVFAGFEMAGTLISYNTGLSFAVMMDSATNKQNSIVANIMGMIAIIIFLSIDGDKIYLTAIAKSYQIVPAVDHNVHLAGTYMLEVATYLCFRRSAYSSIYDGYFPVGCITSNIRSHYATSQSDVHSITCKNGGWCVCFYIDFTLFTHGF